MNIKEISLFVYYEFFLEVFILDCQMHCNENILNEVYIDEKTLKPKNG